MAVALLCGGSPPSTHASVSTCLLVCLHPDGQHLPGVRLLRVRSGVAGGADVAAVSGERSQTDFASAARGRRIFARKLHRASRSQTQQPARRRQRKAQGRRHSSSGGAAGGTLGIGSSEAPSCNVSPPPGSPAHFLALCPWPRFLPSLPIVYFSSSSPTLVSLASSPTRCTT